MKKATRKKSALTPAQKGAATRKANAAKKEAARVARNAKAQAKRLAEKQKGISKEVEDALKQRNAADRKIKILTGRLPSVDKDKDIVIRPEHFDGTEVVPIKTYDDYKRLWANLVSSDYVNTSHGTTVILGRPGLCKTWYAREHHTNEANMEALSTKAKPHIAQFHLFTGNVRPIRAFIGVWEHDGKVLCFDDCENLWGEKTGKDLMLQLMEGEFIKHMEWSSSHASVGKGDKAEAPRKFTTKSRIILIGNQVFTGQFKHEAIKSRAKIWWFCPTKEEIHNYVGGWFPESEIYNYIADRLHDMVRVDCRLYTKCLDVMVEGADWKDYVKEYMDDPRLYIVRKVEAANVGVIERAKMFKEEMTRHGIARGTSQAAYYRVRADFMQEGLLDETPQTKWKNLPHKKLVLKSFDRQGHLLDKKAQKEAAGEKAGMSTEEKLDVLQDQYDKVQRMLSALMDSKPKRRKRRKTRRKR